VLQAFFDESGIHGSSEVCAVAGFVASRVRWDEFERRLRAACGHDVLQPGFHAKSFFDRDPQGKRVSPFTAWDDERAKALLVGLVKCIRDVDIHPVGALVDVQAFRRYTIEQRRFLTGGHRSPYGKRRLIVTGSPNRPYYLPFESTIIQAIKLVKRANLKVHFVFDQQHVLAPFAVKLYRHIKDGIQPDWQRRMGSLDFVCREDALPLQAADLLAYCWYQLHLHVPQRRRELDTGVQFALDAFARKNFHVAYYPEKEMDEILATGYFNNSE